MKRNILLLTMSVCIFLFVSFSSSSVSVSAENNEIDALKQKITRLENRIKDLESLLKIYNLPAEQDIDKKYGCLNKKTWRSLKKGMTEDEVRKILGEPVKTVEGFRTIWYYPSFYSGIVSFDEKGNLIGWNAP
jgi:hypothetical protein